MRILHTADWHLGDRLGRIDRTDDLRRAVERVGDYCVRERVDVLLVAGDLFSELARPDGLRETIEHWQQVFRPFLTSGGTVLTLTGNHDNENFCQTLTRAMDLAAPMADAPGEVLPPGRLYLATDPTLLRLRDRHHGNAVQFLLMPYPTPTRYLRDLPNQKYASPEEKNARLMTAFLEVLRRMQRHERFNRSLPSVLAAHINVRGAAMGNTLFRMTEEEDVLFEATEFKDEFAYVALGHVHRPQAIGGLTNVRYCGSIERMDLGESGDHKGVIVFDLGPTGLQGEPRTLPLESTPVYEIDIRQPATDLPLLKERYAEAQYDLVNLHITYTAGTDSLEDVLRELDAIFPRWYARDWKESSTLGAALQVHADDTVRNKSFAATVRDYVRSELVSHTDAEREEILARLETLLREETG